MNNNNIVYPFSAIFNIYNHTVIVDVDLTKTMGEVMGIKLKNNAHTTNDPIELQTHLQQVFPSIYMYMLNEDMLNSTFLYQNKISAAAPETNV